MMRVLIINNDDYDNGLCASQYTVVPRPTQYLEPSWLPSSLLMFCML